jgi:lipid-binding SYLF domain-containing protein
MRQIAVKISSRQSARHTVLAALCCAVILAVTLPAWCADKSKDEETLNNAAAVLQAMLSSDSVPQSVLAKAQCIIILPNVKKVGFGIGGNGGRGPMNCRSKTNGEWSAPAMFTIGGASFGLQFGGSSTDFVLLVMDEGGVDALLKGKTKLGNEASVAAGPSGATAANSVGGADILTYAKTKGLFAGVSLGGATLQPDNDANKRLYDKTLAAREIVLENAVRPPAGAQALVVLLNSKAAKHGS